MSPSDPPGQSPQLDTSQPITPNTGYRFSKEQEHA
nr:MAG TPA: hypothetical protein [Caudoviricetes sp.]